MQTHTYMRRLPKHIQIHTCTQISTHKCAHAQRRTHRHVCTNPLKHIQTWAQTDTQTPQGPSEHPRGLTHTNVHTLTGSHTKTQVQTPHILPHTETRSRSPPRRPLPTTQTHTCRNAHARTHTIPHTHRRLTTETHTHVLALTDPPQADMRTHTCSCLAFPTARAGSVGRECCLQFYKGSISQYKLVDWYRTSGNCPNNAIV